jgi:hypothetical protein
MAQYTDVEIKWHEELAEVARHIETWGFFMPKDQKLQMDQCMYVVFGYMLNFIPSHDACYYMESMPPIQADIYQWDTPINPFAYWWNFVRLNRFAKREQRIIANGILANAKLELKRGYHVDLIPYHYFDEIVHEVLRDYTA